MCIFIAKTISYVKHCQNSMEQIKTVPSWLSKLIHRQRRRFCASLVRTYREISSASVDELWQKVVDLTDISFSFKNLF